VVWVCWRRLSAASDIVWRRRRRRTLDEICGKKLSSRLRRGHPPLRPVKPPPHPYTQTNATAGRRRQPSAFKYCVYAPCVAAAYIDIYTLTHTHTYLRVCVRRVVPQRKLIVRRQPNGRKRVYTYIYYIYIWGWGMRKKII